MSLCNYNSKGRNYTETGGIKINYLPCMRMYNFEEITLQSANRNLVVL